jgi:hypothetical protein
MENGRGQIPGMNRQKHASVAPLRHQVIPRRQKQTRPIKCH